MSGEINGRKWIEVTVPPHGVFRAWEDDAKAVLNSYYHQHGGIEELRQELMSRGEYTAEQVDAINVLDQVVMAASWVEGAPA
jgi:hypothetical protein